jgi:hypothetical protein
MDDVSHAPEIWTLIKRFFAPLSYTIEMKKLYTLDQNTLLVKEILDASKSISAKIDDIHPFCTCITLCKCSSNIEQFHQKEII